MTKAMVPKKPDKNNEGAANRALSSERTSIKNGAGRQSKV
jgi:hypothetical protein